MSKSKMQVAIDSLLQRDPFYAMVIAPMDVIEDSRCPTAYTDGRVIGFNPDYVASLSMDQTIGLAVHEALHVVMLHHLRRDGRDRRAWNIAGDKEINCIAINAGYTLPDAAVMPDAQRGEEMLQSIDYYYREPKPIDEPGDEPGESGDGESGTASGDSGTTSSDQPSDGGSQAGDDGEAEGDEADSDPGQCGEVRDYPGDDGGEASEAEIREAEAEVITRVVRAYHQADKMGNAPGGIGDVINGWKKSADDPWAILRQHVQAAAKSDYTFKRPNVRLAPMGIYAPSLHSEQLGEVVFAFDMSASMTASDRETAASHAKRIVDDYSAEAITVVCCDSRVQLVERIEHDQPFDPDLPTSGGGTNYDPVFKWIEDMSPQPSLVIYFTDTECNSYPRIAPDYPVIWAAILHGREVYRHFRPSFGEVIEIM